MLLCLGEERMKWCLFGKDQKCQQGNDNASTGCMVEARVKEKVEGELDVRLGHNGTDYPGTGFMVEARVKAN